LDEYRNPSTTTKASGEDDDFQRADSVMTYYEGGHGHGHDHGHGGHGHDHGHDHGDKDDDEAKYVKAMG